MKRRRLWPRLGVVGRMMFIHAVIVIAAMSVVIFFLSRAFTRTLVRTLDTSLAEEVTEYRSLSAHRRAGQSLPAFSEEYLQSHLPDRHRVLLLRFPDGAVFASTGAAALRDTLQVAAWLANPPSKPLTTDVDVPAAARTYHVRLEPGASDGDPALIAGDDQVGVRGESRNAFTVIGVEAGVAVLIALASTYLLLGRALGTVDKLTAAAGAVGSEDLGYRLNYSGPDDEIGRLARTFDDMLSRLDGAFQSQHQLLSDVSHQLRTPLTVIRGHVEVLQRGEMRDRAESAEIIALVMDEIDRTARLIDQLLLLGRSMEPTFVEVDRVDLRSFMSDTFEAAQALAPRTWSLGAVPDVVVLVDGVKLRGALLNLIDNAVKATGPQDSIAIDAQANEELVLTIADSGRGIPLDRQTKVFERFVGGGAPDDGGSGLGLAIVKAIAEGHGGRVTLESAPGAGCTVRIILPGTCIERAGGPAAFDVP